MCGIVGCVIKYNTGLIKQTEDSFFELLFADTLRGDDSTGVIGVEKDGSFHVMKEAAEATWCLPQFKSSTMSKAMWNEGKAYIGHNRKSTVGKTTDSNAHPFIIDDEFALVHNGTLYQHKKLADTEVDSEALATVLAKAFEEEDYKTALETLLPDVYGAYAVALYDQRHQKVRLLRNKERPLAIVETPNAWYFASEPGMLFWILSRNGYTQKDMESLRLVPVETVITFDLSGYPTSMTEESLVLKKGYSPSNVQHGRSTSSGNTTHTKSSKPVIPKGGTHSRMSKNEYKRFRKQWLGQRIYWWADDFVESNFPRTLEQGETKVRIMGQCDSMDRNHLIVVDVDISELGITPKKVIEVIYSARIHDMVYQQDHDRLMIYVTGTVVVPGTKSHSSDIIDAKYIQEKLDEQEKNKSTLH